MWFIIFLCLINSSNSTFVFILHVPSLSFVGPKIFLNTFLSNTINLFFMVSFKTHTSQTCVTIGLIILQYSFNFAVPHLPKLSHKRQDFRRRGGITEHKMWVLIFSKTSAWNIYHSKKNRARYGQKYILVFMLGPRYSCHILMKLEFCCTDFRKNIQIPYFMKICPVRAQMFHMDRRTLRR